MYQVLYRKYRPKVFSDVVGQDHITTTLAKEVETDRLSHAYLFTGSRGTGKTTCAKILSKAVNCLNPQNGNPCGECEVCRGIEDGSIMDVVEIDAASNNGVDNIRDIRDEVTFAPAKCKYRVYIIDEVHMLSIGAFNALLKTLEEPPEHVKFILATTEVNKLPVTILSRCQRFDFKRVSADAMIKRMKFIAESEGFVLEDDAAALIARLADGGMRDALSTLDQCVCAEKTVTTALVSQVAGITGRDHLFLFADAVAKNDCAECISIINELHSNSFDMERLCSDLIDHFRSLMIVKTVKDADGVLMCTEEDIERFNSQSKLFTLENILLAIDLLQSALSNIKRGVNRRIEMEMTAVKLSSPKVSADIGALISRISKLEAAVKNPSLVQSIQNEKPEKSTVSRPPEAYVDEAPEPAQPTQPSSQQSQSSEEADDTQDDVRFVQWPQVLSELSKTNKPLWSVLIGSEAFIRGSFVLIKSENPVFSEMIRSGKSARCVKEAIYAVVNEKYRLGIYSAATKAKQEQPQVQAEPEKDGLSSLIERAHNLGINVEQN